MTRRAMITFDLGAGAPIEVIRQMIDDLDSVCQFGGALQYQAAIAEAESAILRRPTAWISGQAYDDFILNVERNFPPLVPWGGRLTSALPTTIIAPAVSRYLEQYDVSSETTTTVESIRYSNPLEIVIGVGAVAYIVLEALKTYRDWPSRRRVNAAVAADAENTVRARTVIRDELVRRFLEGNLPISPQQLNDFLTLDVAGSMQALGDSAFTLRELEEGDNEDHGHEEQDK